MKSNALFLPPLTRAVASGKQVSENLCKEAALERTRILLCFFRRDIYETSRSKSSKKSVKSSVIRISISADTKNITTELTWRQTHASWQRKQRRCLPLTSSDLLDASSISPRRFTTRNFRRNAERVFLIFKQAVLCVFKHEASNYYSITNIADNTVVLQPVSKKSLYSTLDGLLKILYK